MNQCEKVTFYTYILLDPRKILNQDIQEKFHNDYNIYLRYEPFYVGKGTNTRFFDHLIETLKYRKKLQEWKSFPREQRTRKEYNSFFKKFNLFKVKKYSKILESRHDGMPVAVPLIWIQSDIDEDALLKEKQIIKFFRDNNINLTNLTDGGMGGNTTKYRTKEQKEITSKKISENGKRQKGNPKLIANGKILGDFLRGKKLEEIYSEEKAKEIRKKLSISRKNKKLFGKNSASYVEIPESILLQIIDDAENLLLTQTQLSEKYNYSGKIIRARIIEYTKNENFFKEIRRKRRIGKKFSMETRLKISEKLKGNKNGSKHN